MITRKILKYYSGNNISNIEKINLNFKKNKLSTIIEENHYIKMKDGTKIRISTSLITIANESYLLNSFYPSFRFKQDFFSIPAYFLIKLNKIKVNINGREINRKILEEQKYIRF